MPVNTTESLKRTRIPAKCRKCGTEAGSFVAGADGSFICVPCWQKRYDPEAPAR
jgi:formylmethanofuran dehydrogenase subunit E